MEQQIECGGFYFVTGFDSSNLAKVELITKKPIAKLEIQPPKAKIIKKDNKPGTPTEKKNLKSRRKTSICEEPDFEFNIWTNPDCSGTEFENGNRTWFYFGIRGGTPFSLLKLNIIDLNKQCKMYSQGMAPVYKTTGRHWERIRDKPIFSIDDDNVFTLSFKYRTLESIKSTTYFAFTYPFTYTELQSYLTSLDAKMKNMDSRVPKSVITANKGLKISNDVNDTIYYHRECVCHSLEGRRVDLITVSSHHNITAEREPRLFKLFPDENIPRPFKFQDKKVVFMSARVHPGETPSSFVFNGMLNLLTTKDDPIALLLRKMYVFKFIPMLNPDGVARGHYRTDTRGVNLNRYYLNPSIEYHPAIYAARQLIRYHHYGREVEEDMSASKPIVSDASSQLDQNELSSCENSLQESPSISTNSAQINNVQNQINELMLSEKEQSMDIPDETDTCNSLSEDESDYLPKQVTKRLLERTIEEISQKEKRHCHKSASFSPEEESGLFLYIDMHGHASKKGVFMYGNHFRKIEDSIDCMLLPKIMSINSQNFQFSACNFTERNMYLRDKRDGTSREGSGRVAVFRITGLVRCYTLECNYNSGRIVNVLPQCIRDYPGKPQSAVTYLSPPKFTPAVFEEIGRSLATSILDLTNSNPWSRIPNSEFHTLQGIKDWLRLQNISQSFIYQKISMRNRLRLHKASQTQVLVRMLRPTRVRPSTETAEESERKENLKEEAGPSNQKRVGRVLQTQTKVATLPKKNIFKNTEAKVFKKFTQPEVLPTEEAENEKRIALSTVSIGLSARLKSTSEQCVFKQGPKRLKITPLPKSDETKKKKKSDLWNKKREELISLPGTSTSDILVYSRIPRPKLDQDGVVKKRRSRTSASPLKFKKSLEKRRSSDGAKKKSKSLFRKSGSLALISSELEKKRKKK